MPFNDVALLVPIHIKTVIPQGCFEIDLICFYLELVTCLCRGLKVAFSSRYFFLYNIVAD